MGRPTLHAWLGGGEVAAYLHDDHAQLWCAVLGQIQLENLQETQTQLHMEQTLGLGQGSSWLKAWDKGRVDASV